MIAYILKSSLSLILLFGLYWLLLRQEKLFIFNRFFLLFSLIFSLVIPFVSIPVNIHDNDVQKTVVTALNNNMAVFSQDQNPISNIMYQSNTEVYIFANACNTDYYIDYGILANFPIFSSTSLTT